MAVQLSGQPDQAAALYGRALALARQTGDRHTEAALLNNVGLLEQRAGQAGKAEELFRAALEINRKLPRRNPDAALEYVRFLQLGSRSVEAEEVLREVLVWNPFSPEAHAERAKLLAAGGKWEKVAEEAEFVLRNAGENVDLLRAAHLLLARAYYRLNQPEKAKLHQSWLKSN